MAEKQKMDAGHLVGMDVMSLTEIGSFGEDELNEVHGNIEAFDDVTDEPLVPRSSWRPAPRS